jgi:hypothetical protein
VDRFSFVQTGTKNQLLFCIANPGRLQTRTEPQHEMQGGQDMNRQ